MINSLEFSLFTVMFLNLSFSLFISCPLFFECLFMLYTMIFAQFPPSTCESGVGSFLVQSRTSLNLLLLAVRLLVYCSGITSTLMRPESWLGSIQCGGNSFYRYLLSFIVTIYPVFTHPPVVEYPLYIILKGRECF